MADTTKPIMSVIVTGQETKLSDLAIGDKQLIFVKDKRKIAIDFNGKRSFFNQIEILETDNERQTLTDPVEGLFYFVKGTAALWTYSNSTWVQITSSPQEIIFFDEVLPEIGAENKLYVDKSKLNISIWNTNTSSYDIIGEKVNSITGDDITNLFN